SSLMRLLFVALRVVSLLCTPLFLFPVPPPPEIYTLSLHDALPIFPPAEERRRCGRRGREGRRGTSRERRLARSPPARHDGGGERDRKSTRLNSSHGSISYAVFCLKKQKRDDGVGRNRPTRRNGHPG